MATQDVKIRITALDKTSGALRNIGKGLSSLTKPLLNMRTALVGVVGAGGIGLLVRQSLIATDSLAKTASKIGTTTEALSALQYAGQITGVEVNTMNMALQRFTRRASEAAVGTGEAKGAIRELGIDARQLVRLPLDQRMLVLADAFSNVENESDKLRLAFKLFDSEGASLVNTLGLGRDGLADLLGEARKLGVVMSSNAADGVAEANDALFRMQSLFGGIVKQTVAALAPAISALADLVTNKVLTSFDDANTGVQDFAKALATDVINGISATIQGFENLVNGLIGAANDLIKIKAQLTGFFTADDEKSAVQLRLAIEGVNEKIAHQQKLIDSQIGRNKQRAETIQARYLQEKSALEELLRLKQENGELDLIDEVSFQSYLTILDGVGAKINNVTNATKGLAQSTKEELPTAFDTFIANLQRTRDLASDITPQLESLGDQAIRGLGDSFTDAITGAKSFSDAIRSMAKSVVDSLIRILVQKYLVDAAFGAITGAFGGGATPAPTGGGGGGGFTGMSFNGGGFTGYGARAGGVDGKGGFPAILHPNESVIDHTRGQSAGVVVNQTINVTTGVQQTVRAEIANLLPQISNAAKAAVADSRMRGGGFSKAMVGA